MTVETLAARLVRVFEGCKLNAYWDKNGEAWTIGYGHTRTAKAGMKIDYAEAERLMVVDDAPLFALVKDLPLLSAAAFVSFGHNCGKPALQDALAGKIQVIQYGRTSKGVELSGLVFRRELEAALIEIGGGGVGAT